jgi:signal transduction histidine kinase
MNLSGYKNIAKWIMLSTIFIILSNTLLISLFYYNNQLAEHEKNLIELKYEKTDKKKELIKQEILNIVEMIEYKYANKKAIVKYKQDILNWIRAIEYDKKKQDYIFVYELLKKEGGDDFARLLINPNRPDIEGKLISTKYKDIKGFAFREKFLEYINLHGESFIKYSYKKGDGFGEKISYLYYFEPLNLIIAKGIYLDDIQKEIVLAQKSMERNVKKQINQNLFLFIFFSIIAIIIAYIISVRIQHVINQKDKKVKSTTKALANLNRELDSRVKKEVEKNKEKEQLLMQKSKFVALGEMISLIAHQWRQPISELNALVLNIKLHHDLGKLSSEHMDKKTKDMENLLEYMSKTIDDFRDFFKPNKAKSYFLIEHSLKSIQNIVEPMLKEYKIECQTNINASIALHGYKNELEQVILNIITNAKDALLEDEIEVPKITIDIYKKAGKTVIDIKDNASGIDKEIMDKIFDPYFTTKDDEKGTGIGLYMSKTIIEKNMDGKLEVSSSEKGSCFSIVL